MKITILLLVSIIICNGKNSNSRRDNELECVARRCCHTRREFKDSKDDIINCKLLSDRECGLHDKYCKWNCNKVNNDLNKDAEEDNDAFIHKFRGISNRKGTYKLPEFDAAKFMKERRTHKAGSPESYNDFVRDSQWVSMDRCGVMYDNELKPDIINNLYLEFTTPEGTSRCTASMISDRWAITAAHCVYGNGDWYSDFELYYNIQDCSEIGVDNFWGNYYSWSTVWMLGDYASNPTTENDMAMIQLDEAPGLGYFGFGYDDGLTTGVHMDMISHPADKDCDKMVQTYALYDFNELDMVSYDVDTSGGASGSCIRKSDDNGIVYGIHASTSGTFNSGSRITSGRYSALCEAIGNGRC